MGYISHHAIVVTDDGYGDFIDKAHARTCVYVDFTKLVAKTLDKLCTNCYTVRND